MCSLVVVFVVVFVIVFVFVFVFVIVFGFMFVIVFSFVFVLLFGFVSVFVFVLLVVWVFVWCSCVNTRLVVVFLAQVWPFGRMEQCIAMVDDYVLAKTCA